MAGSGAPFGTLVARLEEQNRRVTGAEQILDRRALGTAGAAAADDGSAEKLPPGVYMRLASGIETEKLSPEDESRWRNSPGGRAIAKWAEMEVGSDEMVKAFHEAFRAVRWHWDAFGGEGRFAHLDGYQKTGQCGSLVKAFIRLVSVAPPYGMGITEGLAVAGYAGQAEGKEYGFGFLAEHPRGLSGLYSNIGPLSSKEAEGYGVNGFPPVQWVLPVGTAQGGLLLRWKPEEVSRSFVRQNLHKPEPDGAV